MIEFPKTFDKCPNCGSEVRIAETVTNQEIAKGKVKPGKKTPFVMARTAIFDKDVVDIFGWRKKAVVLFGFFDVCADCGTFYCIHADEGEGTVDMGAPAMPSFS